MQVSLEAVGLAPNIIGEVGAFSKLINLILYEVVVDIGENVKLGESSFKSVGVVSLSLSRDGKVYSAPECLNLRGKSNGGEDQRSVGND